jgi:uncharacterized protein (DUF433 family)
MDYKNYIKITPGKRSGKPCIRDTRVTVYDILEMLANSMSFEEIIDDFPELTKKDIYSCLAYAADREQNQIIITQ